MVTRKTGRKVGRPGVPAELHVLHGNPGRRPITAPVDTAKPDGIPPYPAQLRQAGKRAWDRYWTYGKVWLAETDVATLTELCQLHDEETRLRRVIEREGWTVRGDDPRFLQLKDTRDFLMQTFDDDAVKVNLVLYKLRDLAAESGDTLSRAHPMLRQLHEIRSRMLPLWIECHLTPSSRGRANVKVPTVDPLDAWQAQ